MLYLIYLYLEENKTKTTIIDSPLEYSTIIDVGEISGDKQNVIEYSEDCVFKNSPIYNQDDIDLKDYNCDSEDISLPPVNMIMDVIEHMLAEVSATSSSSSSISEPGLEPLEVVPESPKLMTSTPPPPPPDMDNLEKLLTHDADLKFSKGEKPTNVEPCKSDTPNDKKINNLSLVCTRIAKSVEPGSDISTPSPLEEMSKLQLRVERTEATTKTTIRPTVTSSLSTMSLLSSVMAAKTASKTVPFTSSASADSDDILRTIGDEKLLNTCTSSGATVNAAADFFNALLRSDKTLTSASNQGNLQINSILNRR